MEPWDTCLALSTAVHRAHARSPRARAEREDRFRAWSLSPPTAEGLSVALLALGFLSIAQDRAAATGMPADPAGLDAVPFTALGAAVTGRPPYALLAGLPPPDATRDAGHLPLLRLLIHDGSRYAPLTVERLRRAVAAMLGELAERHGDPWLSCRRLPPPPAG